MVSVSQPIREQQYRHTFRAKRAEDAEPTINSILGTP